MYSLAIYLYRLAAHLVALFNPKVRLMVNGHQNTWKILRQQIDPTQSYVWFHAASLGEFEQGRPLMERLRREHPEKKILLTFFSPSGYEVRKNYDGADVICYLPFDTPTAARRFVRWARPEAAYFIKYEFWRNYIEVLHRNGIPLYSVSSIFRPNQIFFRFYGRNYARCLRRFTHLFVQNELSKQLLSTIGVTDVTVVGDTRFDRVVDIMRAARPLPLVASFAEAARTPIVVAGSSWGPDEEILIHYFNQHPDHRLILAPHVVDEAHLQAIESKLTRPAIRYSKATPELVSQAHCLIIDTYGLLSSIYRYATIAYVGGGFGTGIHNVPEAAVYGVPVMIGPRNEKFQEAQALLRNGGCIEIHSSDDYVAAIQRFFTDQEALTKAGQAAGDYIRNHSGAADTIFRYVMGK